MACSICYSVYTLKDHYLYRDFNVSINVPKRSLGRKERLSLLDSRGNLTWLRSAGSRLPDSTSFPDSCKKSQPTILMQGWEQSPACLSQMFWGWGGAPCQVTEARARHDPAAAAPSLLRRAGTGMWGGSDLGFVGNPAGKVLGCSSSNLSRIMESRRRRRWCRCRGCLGG